MFDKVLRRKCAVEPRYNEIEGNDFFYKFEVNLKTFLIDGAEIFFHLIEARMYENFIKTSHENSTRETSPKILHGKSLKIHTKILHTQKSSRELHTNKKSSKKHQQKKREKSNFN
jgi:hypothetical protein